MMKEAFALNLLKMCTILALFLFGVSSVNAECRAPLTKRIQDIYTANQADLKTRPAGRAYWVEYARRLNVRIEELKNIQKQNGLCGADDYLLAANVVAHGPSIEDNLTAIQYASTAKSLSPDSLEAKRLYAVVLDELLIRMNAKQIYGTQYENIGGKITRSPQLVGAVPDAEVRVLGINSPEQSPLAQ
jgi:hypothetical protein